MLGSFAEVRRLILEECASFASEYVTRKFIGSWDVLDLLAHLRGWDFTNLQSARDILQGRLPDFYGHYDKDWASYNALLVKQHRRATLTDMVQAVQESHAELLQYLEQLSPSQLLNDQGVRHGNYKVIISRLIEAETRDERRHLEQIRRFRAQNP